MTKTLRHASCFCLVAPVNEVNGIGKDAGGFKGEQNLRFVVLVSERNSKYNMVSSLISYFVNYLNMKSSEYYMPLLLAPEMGWGPLEH